MPLALESDDDTICHDFAFGVKQKPIKNPQNARGVRAHVVRILPLNEFGLTDPDDVLCSTKNVHNHQPIFL